jgi:hypothetical protein
MTLLICLLFCMKATALEIRDDEPSGKNWKKIGHGYYMNINTVKKIYAKIYQIDFSNSIQGATLWDYFTDRIDCDTRMTWTQNKQKEWIGPLTPSDYHKAAAEIVCKAQKR